MAFSSIPSADIAAGKPVDVDLMANIKDNDDALFASASGAIYYDVPNGDMEITGTAWPANWFNSSGVAGYTAYPGGTGSGIETTSPLNGSQSMAFVHPGGAGNGGGYSDSEYIPCGEDAPFRLSWLISSTAAGTKNQVIIRWFTAAKVACASPTTTVYDSVTNPTTATQFGAVCNPVSTARFYKVRLVGGENSVDVAGTVLFDAVTVSRARIRKYTVPSSVASISFLNITESKKLSLQVQGGVLSTGGAYLCQVSADNGTTWVTSSVYFDALVNAADTTSSVAWSMFGAGGTGSISGEASIYGLGEADYTSFASDSTYRVATPGFTNVNNAGGLNTTTAYNAIKIYVASGTIDAGTFILEELY